MHAVADSRKVSMGPQALKKAPDSLKSVPGGQGTLNGT